MLPAHMVFANSSLVDSLGLIAIFFVLFPVLAQGLIAFAIAQALGERRQNRERNLRHGQDASRG